MLGRALGNFLMVALGGRLARSLWLRCPGFGRLKFVVRTFIPGHLSTLREMKGSEIRAGRIAVGSRRNTTGPMAGKYPSMFRVWGRMRLHVRFSDKRVVAVTGALGA